MRYTTAIDISDELELYRNKQLVLLYFHLCLRSGYHADDRDLYRRSIRVLANDVGITVSACRHALRVLIKHRLVEIMPGHVIKVVKFIEPEVIPKRMKKADVVVDERYRERMEEQQRQEERLQKMRDDLKSGATGPIALLTYLEEKAKNGDAKAKKEVLALRKDLKSQGII